MSNGAKIPSGPPSRLARLLGLPSEERTWDITDKHRGRIRANAHRLLGDKLLAFGQLDILPRQNNLGEGQRYITIEAGKPFELRAYLAEKRVSFRETGPRTRIYLGPGDTFPGPDASETGHLAIYRAWIPAGERREKGDMLAMRTAMAENLTMVTGVLPSSRVAGPTVDYKGMRIESEFGEWALKVRLTFSEHDIAIANQLLGAEEQRGTFRHPLVPTVVCDRNWESPTFELTARMEFASAGDEGNF